MKNFFMMLLLCGATGYSQTQSYTASTENFANPERGFYKYTSTYASAYEPLILSSLQSLKSSQKVTLVWREFVLDMFRTTAISSTYLSKMQTDFNTIRSAGMKAVIRFNYSNVDGLDASKTQIFSHIDQLKAIIQANEDVISSVEAGFIGNYGEWYASVNFGQDNLTSVQLTDRKAVGLKIMELAPNRMVAFRTPTIQRLIAGSGNVTESTAFNGSVLSRTAAHNDCFLSSSNDYGTYTNSTTDYTYLENQSKYTFDGGETCSLTQYSSCANAMLTMNRFHFNYLNTDYNQTVVNSWGSNGCLDEITRRLGYRFELLNSNVANNMLTINLQNVGYGNVFNERKAFIVMKNTSTNTEYSFELPTDVRKWNSGSQTQIVMPMTMDVPAGNYQLFLNVPDSKLSTNAAYSIQFANTGVWDAVKGFNSLNQIFTKVSGGTVVVTPTPINPTPTNPTPPTNTGNPVATGPVAIILNAGSVIEVANLPSPIFTVEVYNMNGKLKSTQLDISNLPNHRWIVKIKCLGIEYTETVKKRAN